MGDEKVNKESGRPSCISINTYGGKTHVETRNPI